MTRQKHYLNGKMSFRTYAKKICRSLTAICDVNGIHGNRIFAFNISLYIFYYKQHASFTVYCFLCNSYIMYSEYMYIYIYHSLYFYKISQ